MQIAFFKFIVFKWCYDYVIIPQEERWVKWRYRSVSRCSSQGQSAKYGAVEKWSYSCRAAGHWLERASPCYQHALHLNYHKQILKYPENVLRKCVWTKLLKYRFRFKVNNILAVGHTEKVNIYMNWNRCISPELILQRARLQRQLLELHSN